MNISKITINIDLDMVTLSQEHSAFITNMYLDVDNLILMNSGF